MPDKKAEKIKQEFEMLKQERIPVDNLRQDIANYLFPLREDFVNNPTYNIDRRKGNNIFDGTPSSALNLASDGILGYMVSPSMKWFAQRLPSRLKYLEEIPEVRLWLSEFTEYLYTEFQNSNYYSEMRMFVRDAMSISPGVLYIEEDVKRDGMCFKALHPRDVYFTEDIYGNVSRMFRTEWLTALQAVEKFGINNLSQQIQYAYENRPFCKYEFIHYVGNRENYDTSKIDVYNKPIESIWMEKSGNTIIRESGFDLFPYIVWRYIRNGYNQYGDTPATYALPEIKRLNIISKSIAGVAQFAAEPPYNIPVEMRGKVKLVPRGENYYGSDPNRRITPIVVNSQFPIALDREEKIRQTIKDQYYVDFFLMLAQSQRQMTAREVSEKMGEKALVLGVAISSLTMSLDNTIDYVALTAMKNGRLPRPPEVLSYYAGDEKIDTIFTGIMAQAQRRIFETHNISSSIEIALPFIQMFPESMDVIDSTASIRKMLVSNGYPEEALRTEGQVDAIRQSRTNAQIAQEQKANQMHSSEVLKKLSQAAKNAKIDLNAIMGSTESMEQVNEETGDIGLV